MADQIIDVDSPISEPADVCDLLLSGVLPRHPKLRVVSIEAGIGKLPDDVKRMILWQNAAGLYRIQVPEVAA
ncbi:MAG: hypothetical protein CL908_12035 [Deltaproteobacteria bacterium]|jgi:hypothetical protein|nr:hypothetical protein [Deltaproteobacteria bacterium]